MKTLSFDREGKYFSPEMETLQITPGGAVLNTSCPQNQFEEIIPVNPDCPDDEQQW